MYQYICHNFNIKSHSPDSLLSPNYLIQEMTISAEGNPDKTQNCDGGTVDDDFKKKESFSMIMVYKSDKFHNLSYFWY